MISKIIGYDGTFLSSRCRFCVTNEILTIWENIHVTNAFQMKNFRWNLFGIEKMPPWCLRGNSIFSLPFFLGGKYFLRTWAIQLHLLHCFVCMCVCVIWLNVGKNPAPQLVRQHKCKSADRPKVFHVAQRDCNRWKNTNDKTRKDQRRRDREQREIKRRERESERWEKKYER